MRTSVVVVGHGPEAGLEACLASVTAQLGPGDEAVLVDNGLTRSVDVAGVRRLDAGGNTGFAGGAVTGVAATSGDVLVFVNSDATILPGALDALRSALEDESVGMACGRVVLEDRPDTVNAAGNPVHVTGLCWAGGLGEPTTQHTEQRDVASVTGAFFAMRRATWDRLGGLDADFFMYYEDTDLSLRCHLAGLRVVVVPEAGATHAYVFNHNPRTMHLLQRNRLTSVLTTYPGPLLRWTLPLLLASEVALVAVAARDRWLREHLGALAWLVRHPRHLVRRRRRVQSLVTHPEALHDVLTTTLSAAQVRPAPGQALLDRLVAGYWRRAVGPRPVTRRAERPLTGSVR